jgi:predicted ATPase
MRTFLIGPNASGKSNFLDIFRFLRDIGSAKGGGLGQAVESRGGVSSIRCLSARRNPVVTLDLELVSGRSAQETWRYCLRFNQDNQRVPVLKEERVVHNGQVLLDRPDFDDRSDPLRLTQTSIEQISENNEFRPIVDFFRSVRYQHLIPQVMRDPVSFTPGLVKDDPYGRDFIQRVANIAPKTRDSRLKKILKVLQVAAPQLKGLSVERDNLGVPHLVGNYEHWRPKGANQSEERFSDGTLRFFGLLWSLFEGDGPLLLEEPELSLHTEIVRRLPQLIERVNRHRKIERQVLISTHSEEMLRDESIGGEEVLRLEPTGEGTILRSPIEDDTDRSLLEAGVCVAEVLSGKTGPKEPEQMLFVEDLFRK